MKQVILLNFTIRRGRCSWGPGWWDSEASQHKSWDFLWILHFDPVTLNLKLCSQFLVLDTPILGSRMPMRRETLKAIETARDNLMQVAIFVMHCYQKSKETVFMISQQSVQFWLLVRRGSRARWELLGLQILTTTTRTNIEQTQGNFCNQQSNWITVFLCQDHWGHGGESFYTRNTGPR